MYLTEYSRQSVEQFNGLWDRGTLDDIPPDHAVCCLNMAFARKREVLTRPGSSLGIETGSNIVRQFLACFDNAHLIPLHSDGLGNIWRDDTHQIILSIPNMIDADFLNMNNHVFIAPMLSSYTSGTTVGTYIWEDPYNPNSYGYPNTLPRLAAGVGPPGTIFNAQRVANTGNTGPGWYGVAISWVTSTGFVSQPSQVPVSSANPNGGWLTTNVALSGDANGVGTDEIEILGLPQTISHLPPNSGVTGIIIWVTKGFTPPANHTPNQYQQYRQLAAQAQLFQYDQITLAGATDPYVLNFYDTDLVISADSLPGNGNVLASLPVLPIGLGLGSVALAKYHDRLLILGTSFTEDPDPNFPGFVPLTGYNDDRIWVSNAGQPETIDNLTGYLVVQTEQDGNGVRTAFELFGVLYICKAVGTFATQDTGSEPNDPVNPWIVNIIDGGIGAYHRSVGTITGSQPSLSFNSTGFLANRNGLFLFNGNVLRPELSWKIRNTWSRLTHGAEEQIRVAVDIYNDIFYVLMPIDGSQTPNLLLVGDYSLGLDAQNIRWMPYSFPWQVNDIMMAAYVDPDGTFDYWLRLGTDNAVYKLDGKTNTDNGIAIDNYYQLAPMIIGDMGSLNIYRFIRYRMAGSGTLVTVVSDQGAYLIQNETNVAPLPFPGNYRDQGIQINFTNEKAMVRFGMNATTDYLRMARVDVFGKARWPTRPNA